MADIQEELDEASSTACARCGKDLMEEENPQYDHEIGNVCHECWHILYPTTFCLVCAEGAEESNG